MSKKNSSNFLETRTKPYSSISCSKIDGRVYDKHLNNPCFCYSMQHRLKISESIVSLGWGGYLMASVIGIFSASGFLLGRNSAAFPWFD